jgi:hypothetical protein
MLGSLFILFLSLVGWYITYKLRSVKWEEPPHEIVIKLERPQPKQDRKRCRRRFRRLSPSQSRTA